MHQGYTEKNSSCGRIYKRVMYLFKTSMMIFYYVKRENNSIVDKLANKGVRNNQVVVVYANNTKVIKCFP